MAPLKRQCMPCQILRTESIPFRAKAGVRGLVGVDAGTGDVRGGPSAVTATFSARGAPPVAGAAGGCCSPVGMQAMLMALCLLLNACVIAAIFGRFLDLY